MQLQVLVAINKLSKTVQSERTRTATTTLNTRWLQSYSDGNTELGFLGSTVYQLTLENAGYGDTRLLVVMQQ